MCPDCEITHKEGRCKTSALSLGLFRIRGTTKTVIGIAEDGKYPSAVFVVGSGAPDKLSEVTKADYVRWAHFVIKMGFPRQEDRYEILETKDAPRSWVRGLTDNMWTQNEKKWNMLQKFRGRR